MTAADAILDICREHQRQFRRFVTPRCQLPQKLWSTQIQPLPLIEMVAKQAALTTSEAIVALDQLQADGLLFLSEDRVHIYIPKVRN